MYLQDYTQDRFIFVKVTDLDYTKKLMVYDPVLEYIYSKTEIEVKIPINHSFESIS